MKFCQLLRYNMTKLFCEKLYIEYGGETIPRPKQVVFAT